MCWGQHTQPHGSPGEESLKPSRWLALWIFSRHTACSFLKMQSECMVMACRDTWEGWKDRQGGHLQAILLNPGTESWQH
jgi:hypothetical protein